VRDVTVGRSLADDQLVGNLAVSVPARQQRNDLALSWRQRVRGPLPISRRFEAQVRGVLHQLIDIHTFARPPLCYKPPGTEGGARSGDLAITRWPLYRRHKNPDLLTHRGGTTVQAGRMPRVSLFEREAGQQLHATRGVRQVPEAVVQQEALRRLLHGEQRSTAPAAEQREVIQGVRGAAHAVDRTRTSQA